MSLIKNTSLYTVGSLLPKIGSFLFLPFYLSILTTSDYGIIISLQTLNAVIIVLFTLSMPRSLYRIYYDYKSAKSQKILLGTVIISVFLFSTIGLVVLFAMQDYVQQIYNSIPFYPYYALSILIVFINAISTIPAIYLRIKEKVAVFVLTSLLLFVLKNILIFIFIYYLGRGAKGYLEAELISQLVFLPIYYYIIYDDFLLRWNLNVFKKINLFSLPIIPSVLSVWVLNLSDRIFIERYFSTSEVGIYSLGYQIAGLVLIFSDAFKRAYDPYFYRIANTHNREKATSILYRTNYIYVLVLIIVSFIISFFSNEGIRLFFNQDYYSTIFIIPIISLAYLISQNSGLLNVMMYQEKKTHFVMFITIGAAIINIALNFIFIPRFGIGGAAYSKVISYLAVFIVSYLMAKKSYFIPYNWRILSTTFSLLLLTYIVFYHIEKLNVYVSLLLKSILVFVFLLVFYTKYRLLLGEFFRPKPKTP